MPSIRFVRWLFIALMTLALSATSLGQIGISITVGPPALPVYEQPPCPAEGYLWTPGYWAYDYDAGDYYWVPGTWVPAPQPGLFWTPGYWAWGGDRFIFNEGYWGPSVGFYGGIAYGYGYSGHGYEGGRWDNGQFFYNRSVNNVNVTNVHNVYNTTVINNTTVNRVSYNGGEGGVTERARPEEEAAAHERHVAPVAAQTQHVQAARADPELRASANKGKPPVAATAKPGALKDSAVVPAKEAGAPYKPAPERAAVPSRPNNSAPKPENNKPPNNASRSETAPVAPPATRRDVPHPPAASEPANSPRPGNEGNPQNGSRPESAPRPENSPRPGAAPRPENPGRPDSPSRPEANPRPEAAPRPGYEPGPGQPPHPEKAPPEKAQHPDKEPPAQPPRPPQ